MTSYRSEDADNCRTCTDFKSWTKMQRKSLSSVPHTTTKQSNSEIQHRRDCPLDKDELGRATWGLLHTIAAMYPNVPTNPQKKDMETFFNVLGNIYPCPYCAADLRKELLREPVATSSQQSLSQWMCRLHNKVNIKLGKPIFDCSKVNERWRDGWLDGSCD